jgi:hypothetical protein
MLAHFSATNHHSAATVSALCLNPQSCRAWVRTVEQHMEHVLARAEQDFTEFLGYDPHRIICLDEQVIAAVDRLGLSWRAFAQTIREAYVLEWYDREDLVPLLQAELKKQKRNTDPTRYQMTVHSGGHQTRRFRSKSVLDLDAHSEYRATPGRYRMVLRCLFPGAPQTAPLLVNTTYDTPIRVKETWALHIGSVSRPAAEKWNEEFTQLICRCGETERTTSYDTPSSSFLFASRHA